VLFKRLVGSAVLPLKQQTALSDAPPQLRAYAFCSSSTPSVSLPAQYVQVGSVTVLWLSLHTDVPVALDFGGSVVGKGAATSRLDFVLSPNSTTGQWQTDVVAEGIRLNGDDLALLPGGIMPMMVPHLAARASEPLLVQPLTYGFSVFPAAAAPACGYKAARSTQLQRTGRNAHVQAARKHRS